MSGPLPIDTVIPTVLTTLREKQSLVLCAPPGSGKTSRVPLAILELFPPGSGRIVMLQPRRVAAAAAAAWMASLLGEETGRTVGYTIRFDSRVSSETRIEVVTEGVLTRRIQNDPLLNGIAAVIFDEFHERSIHADLALALSVDVQRNLREDLKIVVMSATMESAPVARLLGNAGTVVSEGSAWPVEERYRELLPGVPLPKQMADLIGKALCEESGDLLAFLPGAGEIRSCAGFLGGIPAVASGSVTLHQLYGDLPFAEQQRAIRPGKGRKVVLATNIAETSLTIDGVRVVLDSGLSRRVQHDPATGMNRLVTVRESRASAVQRAGRAGRQGPGVCYRLFSSHSFAAMTPDSPPEILASDLTSLVLELAAWGIDDPENLNWLDLPPPVAWAAGRALLENLGALDRFGRITRRGTDMVRLPLHPRLSSMLLKASELGCLERACDIAALVSERDIVRRDTGGGSYSASACDLHSRLEMLDGWRHRRSGANGLDSGALAAVERVAGQLRTLMKCGASGEACSDDDISRLLLAAYPDRVAVRRGSGDAYLLSSGRGARLSRSCGAKGAQYLIAVSVDGGEGCDALVRQASPLYPDLLRRSCGDRILPERRVSWNAAEGRLEAVKEERYGALVISSVTLKIDDGEALPVLLSAVRESFSLLRFSDEATQFRGRVRLLASLFPEEEWPDLSDAGLAATLELWLAPWLAGVRTLRGIEALNLFDALKVLLPWEKLKLLDGRLPTHLAVPSGHRIAIDYCKGERPVLAVKLQELFGLASTPLLAMGRVRLLIHLLSPARRPLAVTDDLESFWNGPYREVKKEMKGRYPRHPWPDDPWSATATRLTNRRLA